MIISHSRKFCFFKVPKTGSTSAEIVMRMVAGFDHQVDRLSSIRGAFADTRIFERVNMGPHDHRHATPDVAVNNDLITEDQLLEYDCFAFVREPSDRFVSAYLHCNGKSMQRKRNVHGVIRDEVLRRQQIAYLQYRGDFVVTPLLFCHHADELNWLLQYLGGSTVQDMPRFNRSRFRGEAPYLQPGTTADDLCDDWRRWFGDDLEFFESIRGADIEKRAAL